MALHYLNKWLGEFKLIRLLAKYDRIILYGAGLVGGLVGNYLCANGLQRKIIGYAVSRKDQNKTSLCGFRIYGIEELKARRNDSLVIVATLPELHREIQKELSRLQFQKALFVTEQFYKDLCTWAMLDFNRQNPVRFRPDAKARVLFMASDNSRTSGAFLCMAELCGQLKKQGIGAVIVLPSYGTGSSLLDEKRLPYTYIPAEDWGFELAREKDLLEKIKFSAALISNYPAYRKICALLKEHQIDLVHCNTTYTYIGAAAAGHLGVPYVWHLRENMENQGCRIFAGRWAVKLMRKAAAVIAVSDYIKGLTDFGQPGLVNVIYDPVEADEKYLRKREIFCSESVQMIIVGAIAPFKGQKELIEACAVLKRKTDMVFHLRIVGKGDKDYVKELWRLVKSHALEDSVTFCGISSRVYELYAQSDISFTCGGREAYGRVTIEAQTAGCLVIGVDSGGTRELIRDKETGYLYQEGSAEALAEVIREAVSRPELSRRIARAGREYASRTYTTEKNLREILDIYGKVLKRSL